MKQMIAIVFLLGLIGWGLYDTGKEKKETVPEVSNSSNNTSNSVVVGIEEGNLAPDFSLQTLDGDPKRLSGFRGKKVILNIWATWCPPCRAEMPDMQKFYIENRDKGIEILAVNLTKSEKSRDSIPAFIKEYSLTFPVVLDEKGEVANRFQAQAIPTSYILDRKGIIRYRMTGPMNYEIMEQLTEHLQ